MLDWFTHETEMSMIVDADSDLSVRFTLQSKASDVAHTAAGGRNRACPAAGALGIMEAGECSPGCVVVSRRRVIVGLPLAAGSQARRDHAGATSAMRNSGVHENDQEKRGVAQRHYARFLQRN